MYLFSRQGDDEVMSAIDADSGKVVWRTAYPAPFTMHGGRGSAWPRTEVHAGVFQRATVCDRHDRNRHRL